MLDRLIASSIRDERRSVLLLGPRQTGKSTLLSALAPDLTINFALERVYLQHASDPGLLEAILAERRPRLVLVGEVQRLPSVLHTIQALLDEAKSKRQALRFLMTGSSARKLRRGNANLLPGRLLTFELGPLIAAELDYDIATERALALGTLPEPYLEESPRSAQRLLKSYAATYLKEEIQAEALTRNLEGFSRFLFAAARSSGSFLDYSKLATQAKVSRTSTLRFFEMLEDTLIAHKVVPYPHAPEADLVKHPRFFFFDTGVLNGLLGSFELPTDRRGFLFEHLVFNQIRTASKAHEKACEIFGFRTRGGLEVDFIVELDGHTWAIEAKTGAFDEAAADLTMERASRYLPAKAQFVVATPDAEPKRLRKARVLPWQRLLREMGL